MIHIPATEKKKEEEEEEEEGIGQGESLIRLDPGGVPHRALLGMVEERKIRPNPNPNPNPTLDIGGALNTA